MLSSLLFFRAGLAEFFFEGLHAMLSEESKHQQASSRGSDARGSVENKHMGGQLLGGHGMWENRCLAGEFFTSST